MLQVLRIQNLAVIEDLTWDLDCGFNILTGETGAGKSILIDAFTLLLGEKADRSLIRDGADACSIEASLTGLEGLDSILEEYGLEPGEEGELILKRVCARSGTNRQFVNGSPTTLQVLKRIGDELVDLHGPHDHQSLLSPEQQLRSLDAYAKIEPEVAGFRERFHALREKEAALMALTSLEGTDWQRQLEFLEFQIREIEEAALTADDEERLDQEYRIAQHGQRILELGGGVLGALGEAEPDVMSLLGQAHKQLQEWEHLDPAAAELVALNASAIAQLQELRAEVEGLMDKTELDGRRMEELERRINVVQGLKRKYGATVGAVLETLEDCRKKRDALANREGEINALEKEIAAAREVLNKEASELSRKRRNALGELGKAITLQLQELGFKKAVFSGELTHLDKVHGAGRDRVEFLFAPNLGETARPLRTIASSGEMARVMLAIKTVLAEKDRVPILIFDEVDANVGGETAVAVAGKLRNLADTHQVLCITHLPQVAAAGHTHVRVEKEVDQGRTYTRLEKLDGSARIAELARMLGGKNESSEALAKTLLETYQKKEKARR